MTEIGSLITNRLKELRITRVELVVRCGYDRNVSKGLRRLDELCAGNFAHSQFLLAKIPTALSVKSVVLQAAIVSTLEAKRREDELRYRATFRPHAIILCERSNPEPIWLAAVIGINRLLRIDFMEGTAPITFVHQALACVGKRLRKWNSDVLPAFGRPLRVVINYHPDRSVVFDLEGQPIRSLEKAVEVGGTLAISGRTISSSEIVALIGVD